jgi:adenylate cyclase
VGAFAQPTGFLSASACIATTLALVVAAAWWRRRSVHRGRVPRHGLDVVAGLIFADLDGYTALSEQQGDRQAAYLASRFAALARAACVGRARVLKTAGDGVMIAAPSATESAETAARLVHLVNADPILPAAALAVTYGACVERGGDLFGTTVNLAARLANVTTPGEVWCTGAVAHAAQTIGFTTSRLEDMTFDGIKRPVTVHRMDPHPHASSNPATSALQAPFAPFAHAAAR